MEKERFLAVVAANPKSKVLSFLQLFFRKSKHPVIYYSFLAVLSVCFGIMFYYGVAASDIGYYAAWPLLMKVAFWLFTVPLVVVVLLGYVLAWLDNRRLRRICDELLITIDQFGKLAKKYNVE